MKSRISWKPYDLGFKFCGPRPQGDEAANSNGENRKNSEAFASEFGAASQIRTGDLILTKDALYRLSYSSGFCMSPAGNSDIILRSALFVKHFFEIFQNFLKLPGRKNACRRITCGRHQYLQFGDYTSSMTAISAASPRRGPVRVTLV